MKMFPVFFQKFIVFTYCVEVLLHLNLTFDLVWGQIVVQFWPEGLVSSPGPSSS